MIQTTLEKELSQHLEKLLPEQQRQVLEFARALSSRPVRGVPGSSLLRFGGSINPAELRVIEQAIQDDCEHIDSNEW